MRDFMLNNLKFVRDGAKSYVYWWGFTHPVLAVAHPDTLKAVLRTSEPKTQGLGGYSYFNKWLGMLNTMGILEEEAVSVLLY